MFTQSIRNVAGALSLLVFLLTVAACGGGPTWRQYEENTTPPPSAAVAEHVHDAGPLHWTSPAVWKAAGGSGMRLETFAIDRGNALTGQCTIVQLGGAAGGLEANLVRWIRQIDQAVPEPAELSAFIAKQAAFKSEGGLEGTLVDLTTLGQQGPDAASMLVGLFSLGDITVFAKLTGPVALLQAEKATFETFCRSFKRGDA